MRLRNHATLFLIVAELVAIASGPPGSLTARAADPAPTCTITLGARTACVTPRTTRQARADGGIVDVQVPSPNELVATLTGTAAANAILGCESAVTQTFHLEQEFEIAGPDAKATEVTLTMESNLVGLVRAKHKAAASAQVASAKICPLGSPETPFVMIHPPFGVGGTDARLCNQRLSPIKVPGMPPGRYVLVADLVLAADATGVVDAHSAADFSPSTTLPADWVRTRDPFQGVDKKDFGFRIALVAEPAGAINVAQKSTDSALARASARLVAAPVTHAKPAAAPPPWRK